MIADTAITYAVKSETPDQVIITVLVAAGIILLGAVAIFVWRRKLNPN